MAWNDWVVKHAKGIVIAWIIVILLATPLAMKLKDVTNYSMDQFLPKDVESVRVQDTLQSDFPSFANSTNQTYMIISGIDVNSPEARKAYERLKEEAKPYGSNFVSYYDAVDLLRNKSSEIAINITKTTANLTSSLYNTTLDMNRTYGTLVQNMSDLQSSIEDTKTALQETAEAYCELRENLSTVYGEVINLKKAVNETAISYTELTENLTSLQNQMRNLSEVINETASAHAELTENLTTVYEKMENLRATLNLTDEAYSELHKNLTETSKLLRSLNTTLSQTNAGVYELNATYVKTYVGTVGVYKVLNKAGAYSTGTPSPATAEAAANETGTSVEFVYAVFNATNPVYQAYGPAEITDGFLAKVTSRIILSSMEDPVQRDLAEAYGYAFYLAVQGFDSIHASAYALQSLPANALLSVSSRLGTRALENTPRVIEASNITVTVPGFGEVDSRTLAEIVNASISLSPEPAPQSVENATVAFALKYISLTQPGNPLLSLDSPEKVLMSLLINGPTKELESELLKGGLMTKATDETRPLVPLIVNATMTHDPNATGAMTLNETLLENATVELMASILRTQGISLDESVLKALYESRGDRTTIENLAGKITEHVLAEELKARGMENADGLAEVIVREATSRPTIPSSSEALENATVEVIRGILAERNLSLDEKYLGELYEGKNAAAVAREILLKEVSSQLTRNGVDEAATLAGVIVNTATANAREIATNGSALENATVEVVKRALEMNGKSIDERYIREIYESGGNEKRLDEIARELLMEELVKQMQGRGLKNPEKTADEIMKEVLRNPDSLARGEGLEEATVEVVVALAGSADLPGNNTLRDIVKKLYNGASPAEIAKELFMDGVKEELDEKNLPGDVKEKVLEIASTVTEEHPLSEELAEELVSQKAIEIVSPKLNDNPVTEGINATLVVDLAMEHLKTPQGITKADVEPLSDELYSKLYDTAKDYIEMLKSKDNRTMLVLFTPKGGEGISDLEKASRAQYENSLKVKELALKEFGKSFNGVKAYITGTPVQTYEAIKYGKEDNDKTTKFSIIGALIVLLVLMGVALLATLLPFTGVATATLTALGILYLLAKGDVVNVGSWAQMLTVTTALGLGIDYSTYYLHRFREYLAEGYDHDGAASEALKRAKDAVLASASTDIIAFASFILAWEFPIFKTMGIIAPLAVITVLVASLTFIPAITVLIGDKPVFWWPRHIEHHLKGVDLHERSRIAEWAVKHAKVAVLIALLVAVPAAYNFASFHGTHDIKLFIPKDSETYHFLQLSDKTVGAGVSSPTYVVIDLGHKVTPADLSKINAIAGEISKVRGVEHVYTLTQPYGKRVNTDDIDALKSLGGDRYLSKDESKVLIQVTGKYEATDERSKEMVREIRSIVKNEEKKGTIESGMVGGNTALALDLSNLINDVFWHRIFPVALLLMFLSLIPTLKGIPAVIATMGTIAVGVLLSISVSSWLFERVFGQQVMWFLPLMVFIVLMGVGIDYNSFYLVKARDEFERRKPEDALVVAAGTMDKLVVGLAAVLAATYGSLMTGATWGIREIGFALALGILLTATLAVYFIGPSTMALFGEKAWWPLHRAEKKD